MANVTVTPSGSVNPLEVAYDPLDGRVYIASNYYDIYGQLTYIDNQTAQSPVIWGTYTLSSLACDETTGYVYVADNTADKVAVFDGLSKLGEVNVGSDPQDIAYDPGNHMVYVPNYSDTTVSVLSGPHVAGTITVGAEPYGVVAMTDSGLMAVSVSGAGALQLLSTLLAIGPSVATPAGNPSDTLDLGQSTTINATVWGLGAGGLEASATVLPSDGSGCPNEPSLIASSMTETVELSCTPAATGNYSVQLNVTDAEGNVVWSELPLHVYPELDVSNPVARLASVGSVHATDIGVPIIFTVAASGGTGNYSFRWSGLPTAVCNSTSLSAINCTFSMVGPLSIVVGVSDTDAATFVSPPLGFNVSTALLASAPTANASSADVGESVSFAEAPQGGSGNYSGFVWRGIPTGACDNATTARPTCRLPTATNLVISATFSDQYGVRVTSPTLPFQVYPMPVVRTLGAARTSADIGQSISFRAQTTGGLGPFTYAWTGLPSTCTGSTDAAPVCDPSVRGVLDVRATAIDVNGGRSAPSADVLIVVFSALAVGTPVVSTPVVPAGQSVSFDVSVSGGAGGNLVNWSGLPDHCTAETTHVDCRPTESGTYNVSVEVTDANGALALSNTTVLSVTAGSGGTTHVGPGGVGSLWLDAAIGTAIAVGVVVVVLWIRFRRSRASSGDRGDSTDPPTS